MAEIVAQAGREKSVTIASQHGPARGNRLPRRQPRFPSPRHCSARKGLEPAHRRPRGARGLLAEGRRVDRSRHERVVAWGACDIIGTRAPRVARVDNQLLGRSGRQGDPAPRRFFDLSLADYLLRIFGSGTNPAHMDRSHGIGEPIVAQRSTRRDRINLPRAGGDANFEIRSTCSMYDERE